MTLGTPAYDDDLSSSSPLAAYSLTEFRPNFGSDLRDTYFWPGRVVTYSFPASGSATSITGTPLESLTPDGSEVAAFENAFRKVEKALGGRLTFVPSLRGTTADMDLIVQRGKFFSGGRTGQCYWYLRRRDAAEIGRVVIRVKSSLSERSLRRTALHEVLHGIGFDGHDRRYGSLMNWDEPVTIPEITLTTRDENTLRAAYYGR